MRALIGFHPEYSVDNGQPLIDALEETPDITDLTRMSLGALASDRTILKEFDALLLEGVDPRAPSTIVEPFARKLRCLREANMPVIGICYGAQLLARIYGGLLLRDTGGEAGLVPLKVTNPGSETTDPLLAGIDPERFEVVSTHNDSFTRPSGFKLLAGSPDCPTHVLRHEAKPVYLLQGHFELSPKHIREPIFRNLGNIAASQRLVSATV